MKEMLTSCSKRLAQLNSGKALQRASVFRLVSKSLPCTQYNVRVTSMPFIQISSASRDSWQYEKDHRPIEIFEALAEKYN